MSKSRIAKKSNNAKVFNDKELGNELGAVIINRQDHYPAIGDWKTELPLVDKGKCIGCSTCAKNCPEGTIEMSKEGKKRPIVHYDFCKGCGVCSVVCPVEAIEMKLRNEQS